MRRARQKLQVSTFPFLAVLLCALGALILLLLVMDRRAKLAARNKVQQEIAARQAARQAARLEQAAEAEAKVKAEWHKQKELLHQALLEQQQALRRQLQALLGDLTATQQQVTQQHANLKNLQDTLVLETARAAQRRRELDQKRTGLTGKDNEEARARVELQRLTEEMLQLEKTLAQLRALKNRPNDAFSLVPYRGKLGDNRKPIYVECNRDNMILHPGRTVLGAWNLTAQQFVDEIQRRAGALAVESRKQPPRNPNAYVLFLVRPDGIENYYKTQAALRGFAIDYGYELVEPHWTFDFADEQIAAKQQWHQPPSSSGVPGLGNGTGPGKSHRVGSPPWPKPPTFGSGVPGVASLPSPPGVAGSSGVGGPGKDPFQPSGQPRATTNSGSNSGGFLPKSTGNSPSASQPSTGAVGAGNSSSGEKPPSVFATLLPPQLGEPTNPGAPKLGTPSQSGGPSGHPPIIASTPGSNRGPSPANPVKLGFQEAPSANQNAGTPGESASAGSSPLGNGPPTGKQPGADSTSGLPGSSGASEGDPGEPGQAGFPSGSTDVPKRPRPAPLSRLLGNHDFIITVECVPQGVILQPDDELYPLEPAQRRPSMEQSLVSRIDQMIQRRQASVRPGEPAYRPQIRFRVLPNGLRAYYWIYPVLERVKVPMSRENVSD